MGMIFDQLLPSANAPCTRMIAGFGAAACAAHARARMAMDKKCFIVPPCRSVDAPKIGPGGSRARLDEGIGQCASGSPELGDLPMSKAIDEMVIHHPDGLHVRVDDRRAYEREAAALEILAHGVRLDGVSRNLPDSSPTILK